MISSSVQRERPNGSDILFVSATIITGDDDAEPYVADLLVSDGLIKYIGSISTDDLLPGTTQIDATGCCLSPGFIDLHAHSDLYLLTKPDHEAKISQGCTTEVVGQDGIGYFPIRDPAQMKAVREQITAWNGNPSDEECGPGGIHEGVGLFEWNDIKGYLDCLERNRTATNVAVLVPQGNLRLLACGAYNTLVTEKQMLDQIDLLREGMAQGAIGMSSGLTYTPGMYASNTELAYLCSVLATEYPGAYYAPHHRSYGHKAMESYEEMLNLARNTNCPVHLTHATLNFPENRNRAKELIKMIDDTRALGSDITLDTYPYLPGCTTLGALLPSWASAGGPAETLKRLENPLMREKIMIAVEVTGCDGGHGIPTDWELIQVGTCHHEYIKDYSGRRVAEIARAKGVRPIEIFFDVLVNDRLGTSCLMHIGNEENVREILQHETHCAGTDAILHGASTHPRAYGTFPRFLAHYARDLKLASIPQMIAHLTSRPAKRMGIYPHRGRIAECSAADLVLFDPAKINDMATFAEPKKRAVGIRWVLVNGKVAMEEGTLTGARGGMTLRRGIDGKVIGHSAS